MKYKNVEESKWSASRKVVAYFFLPCVEQGKWKGTTETEKGDLPT